MPILSDDDVQAVTGYRRPSAQARALTSMGIAHKRRPDGTILLTAEAVEESLRTKGKPTAAVAEDDGFNWSK